MIDIGCDDCMWTQGPWLGQFIVIVKFLMLSWCEVKG